MQLTVKGKNFQVTDALREYAEKRLGKMIRFSDDIISTDITLSTERNWHIVEVTVYANGFVLRGEERTDDMYASIDLVLEKLERQLKKQKGKFDRKGRTHKGEDLEVFHSDLPRGEEEEASIAQDRIILQEPMVIRSPMLIQKPMTVEEAIKEIEAHDFSFFVFINAKTDLLNVIYRRKTGYGVIDPSFERVMDAS